MKTMYHDIRNNINSVKSEQLAFDCRDDFLTCTKPLKTGQNSLKLNMENFFAQIVCVVLFSSVVSQLEHEININECF